MAETSLEPSPQLAVGLTNRAAAEAEAADVDSLKGRSAIGAIGAAAGVDDDSSSSSGSQCLTGGEEQEIDCCGGAPAKERHRKTAQIAPPPHAWWSTLDEQQQQQRHPAVGNNGGVPATPRASSPYKDLQQRRKASSPFSLANLLLRRRRSPCELDEEIEPFFDGPLQKISIDDSCSYFYATNLERPKAYRKSSCAPPSGSGNGGAYIISADPVSEPMPPSADYRRRSGQQQHKWSAFAMWPSGITNGSNGGNPRPKSATRVRRKASCPVTQQSSTTTSTVSPSAIGHAGRHHGSVTGGPSTPMVGSPSPMSNSVGYGGQHGGSFFSSSTNSLGGSSSWNLFRNLNVRSASSASASPSATPPPSAYFNAYYNRTHAKKSYPYLDSSSSPPPVAMMIESLRFAAPTSQLAGRVTSQGEIGSYALRSPRRSSPAADSGKRRRSVRKQRYYGSVEMMVTVDASGQVRNAGRFRVEPGADHLEPDVYQGESELPTSPVMVEDPEVETRWYFRHFLGREHQNFAGVDNQKAPFFLSVLMEDAMADGLRCRAILWRSTGSKKLVFPYGVGSSSSNTSNSQSSSSSKDSGKENAMGGSGAGGCANASASSSINLPQKPLTARSIVQKFPGMIDLSHGLKEITDPKLQKDLLILEEQEGAVNFKFGVIYAKHKQESDDEMLSNETGSEAYENFLTLLGDHVTLQGFNKFRGGLDAKTNSTGNESVYTVYEGHEIMFHCSTMLPYSQGNKQQLERKRHIGNDIVNIIFEDEGDPADPSFSPTAMKSHFTHIFAVVTFDKNTGCYRLWVFSEETVPAYGPFLPNPNEFYDPQQFREFILTKLINGEKAAFRSQVFSEKRYRTTDTLIKDMYIEYLKKEFCRGSLHKVSEAVVRHLRSPRSKEFDNNLVEFVRMGEHLKLTKSMSGEAPNVLAVSTLYRKQPWEPQLLCPDMPLYDSYSSDSWGNRSLLLATDEAGAIFVNEGVCTPLFEPACLVQQLSVLENFGILVVRCEKGKDGYIGVFSLSHMRSLIRAGQTIQKKQCLEHRVAGTKGCQLYAITGNNSLRLSVAVSMGKKLAVLRWTLTQTTGMITSPDIIKNFDLIKEMSLNDEPLTLALFESGLQANIKVCAANKNGLDLIDFADGCVSNLYRCSLTKNSITSLLAACDVESEDILLTFDHTTLVFDLCEEVAEPLVISWTANPHSIAYCFPFVLAFGMDTIEIRLAVNGNLFTSLYMPNVRLLAAKEDIFFAVDRMSCPFTPNNPCNNNGSSPKFNRKQLLSESKSTGNTSNNSSGNGASITNTPPIAPPRRWSQLYKIPIKNLLRSGPRGGAGPPGAAGIGGGGPAGAPTPGHHDDGSSIAGPRSPFPSMTGNNSNGLITIPSGMGNPTRKPSPASAGGEVPSALPGHMLVRNSVGSDSGWSSSQGRYSTASSLEVDGSSPPSPGGESSGDVLL